MRGWGNFDPERDDQAFFAKRQKLVGGEQVAPGGDDDRGGAAHGADDKGIAEAAERFAAEGICVMGDDERAFVAAEEKRGGCAGIGRMKVHEGRGAAVNRGEEAGTDGHGGDGAIAGDTGDADAAGLAQLGTGRIVGDDDADAIGARLAHGEIADDTLDAAAVRRIKLADVQNRTIGKRTNGSHLTTPAERFTCFLASFSFLAQAASKSAMNSRGDGPKTIAVNGRFLAQSTTGVQRYAHELLRALDGLLQRGSIPPVAVTVLTPQGTKHTAQYSFLKVRCCGRLQGQLWEQLELPVAASGSLLFTPCGGSPVVHGDQVVTIHDAAPFATPEAYTLAYRSYYKGLQRVLARRVRHILTVSEFSRQELARFLRISPQRITAVHESGEHVLRSLASSDLLARHGLVPGRYVLAVGSMNPNKNLHGVMRAAKELRDYRIQVAIAGGVNARIFSSSAAVSDSAVLVGVVNDAELRGLYENAGCFVFPSFYEGFGLPPLEALTLGCPVVAARAGAMPEVLGDAVLYCDPASPANIAAQVRRVMRGEGPSRATRQAHVGAFTWERCARETWAVLLRAMGKDAEGIMATAAGWDAEPHRRAG